MNTQIHTAIAAWTLFSLLNQSEGQISGFRTAEDKVEEVKYELLPGYNQATVGQSMKIELHEQLDSRFIWKLIVPQDVEIIQDVGNKDNKHEWLIRANKEGRYKVIADYMDKRRMLGSRKRILFEIEVLPCPCNASPYNKKQNTTK